MLSLTLLPLGKEIEVEHGTILLDAIRQAGIEIPSLCNGQQVCGKCKVRINSSIPPSLSESLKHLTAEEFAAGYRLACEIVIQEDMQVILPEEYSLDTRILEGDLIKKSRIAPAVEISHENGRFYLHYRDRSPTVLNTWRSGFSPKGLAIDLGTTTLVLTLIDLKRGVELVSESVVNPQTQYGQDVITRIHESSTQEGLEKLSSLISDGLNSLLDKACQASGTHPHEIVDAAIGGNTTMLQMAAAIDPSPLGKAPFIVGIEGGRTYPASVFGLPINPEARVYIPSVAHAFVGSDISAGLSSIDFFSQGKPTLFIDMGTNGEMALIADGQIYFTSTATGPAFEGMGISHGMGAACGAVEMVWVDDNFVNIKTIDDAPVKGICGSGIIDLVACLIQLDALEPSGFLRDLHEDNCKSSIFSDRYEVVDGIPAIKLADMVYFTQKDIRQFQLAKSAIQTGMEMLLSAAGIDYDQLEKIVIAGAFGYHLRAESLRQIGLIPYTFQGEIDFAGNTSRIGSVLMLIDSSSREYLQYAMKQIQYIDIAEESDFYTRFIQNLSFACSSYEYIDLI